MTATETTVTSPAAAAPKAAKPAKKTASTKAVKKAVKATPVKGVKKKAAKADKPAQSGVERDHDLPWNAKKVAVFKALRSPKLNAGYGMAQEIADLTKGVCNARDVRHYCYHAAAAGLVSVKEAGEGHGNAYVFGLTAKGKSVDPDAELKARKAKAVDK